MSELTLNKGSDFTTVLQWRNGETPINLTGYTASMYDVTDGVTLAAAITDAAGGEVTVTCEWTEDYFRLREFYFRVIITTGGVDTSTPRIFVRMD